MLKLKGKWGPLILLSLASFIMVIDTTAMNVSISYLVQDLDTTIGRIQNIMSVYTLIMASLMLLGAKIADIIGKSKSFIIGTIVYGVGTSVAALSANTTMLLIGWSIIEGFAAALMMPTVLALITNIYKGKDRAIAFSIQGAMASIALCAGPILGGLISTYLSWRFVFGGELIIVIAILMFSGTFSSIKNIKVKNAKIDWMGVALTIFSLSFLILGFLMAKNYGWLIAKTPFVIGKMEINIFGLSITPVLLFIGLIFLILLFAWLKHRVKVGKSPLFHPNIFKNKIFSSGVTIGALTQMAFVGSLFTMPVYLQTIDGYTGFETGLAILPLSLSLLFISFFAPKLSWKISPKYLLLLGTLLMGTGLIILFGLFSEDKVIKGTDLIPGYIFMGLGIGMIVTVINNVSLSNVKPELQNEGSGMVYTFNNLGNSLSTAIIGSILIGTIISSLATGLADSKVLNKENYTKSEISVALEKQSRQMETDPLETIKLSSDEKQEFKRIIVDSFSKSMQFVLIASLFLVVIDFFVILFILPRVKLKEPLKNDDSK